VGIHDQAPLVREFETGLGLLPNGDAFMAGIAGVRGRGVLCPPADLARAEMRALGFLHRKRDVVAATAIAPSQKRKRADFMCTVPAGTASRR
jgi:hypothetical protein